MNKIQYFVMLLEEDKLHIWFLQGRILGHAAEILIELLGSFSFLFLGVGAGGRGEEELFWHANGLLETQICALPAVSFQWITLENNVHQIQSTTEDEILSRVYIWMRMWHTKTMWTFNVDVLPRRSKQHSGYATNVLANSQMLCVGCRYFKENSHTIHLDIDIQDSFFYVRWTDIWKMPQICSH